ncbi:MAG: DUF2793 domain-containing protein [Rhizobiales bacterium]|nr:DUF2793 domain-containing protein [Hyphomicrobiales bacterium]
MPTPNLGLPQLAADQAQKHVTVNEALYDLDALVQLAVLDRSLAAPPGSPADGARYIVAASPTGAWAGHTDHIAAWLDGAWRFFIPGVGWLAWVVDEAALLAWNGSAWVDALSAVSAIQNLALLGIRTAADATNRLAVKSDGVLLSHDDVTPGTGHMRVALNKSAAAKDAGFTFQDAFSTRALFGLLGDDDFTIKVSPDGSTFYLAVSIDKDTGHVGLGGATADANNALIVKGTAFLFDRETDDVRFTFNKAAAGDDVALTFQTNYSARALFGLLGDDDFTVKVSPDGSNYFTGFVVDRSTGRLKLPLAPKFSAYTNFDNYIAANTWTKVQFNNADSNDQNAFNGSNNNFTAPFAGTYTFGFSLRFKANATVPTKVTATFYKNGAELGRGRAVSGAPVDDVTTYNLTVLTPLATNDVIDVRVHFATNDGYIESDQSHFWGHYVP